MPSKSLPCVRLGSPGAADEPATSINSVQGQPGRRLTGQAHPVIVPIRSLGSSHRPRIASHLLALSSHDRYLRFGYAAGEGQILQYVRSLDFGRDEIFGIYNRKLQLIAVAHLAYAPRGEGAATSVELGISVAESARGRGFGARLFERAAMHARNDGISQMHIHALSENTAMLRIARAAGARVLRDGSEAEAYLQLPAPTFDSRLSELLQEQFAQMDYGVKSHAQPFWQWHDRARNMEAL